MAAVGACGQHDLLGMLQIVRELRQLCKEELPEYVQPVSYKFISEMPMTPVGKVDYRKLEEEITPRDY